MALYNYELHFKSNINLQISNSESFVDIYIKVRNILRKLIPLHPYYIHDMMNSENILNSFFPKINKESDIAKNFFMGFKTFKQFVEELYEILTKIIIEQQKIILREDTFKNKLKKINYNNEEEYKELFKY